MARACMVPPMGLGKTHQPPGSTSTCANRMTYDSIGLSGHHADPGLPGAQNHIAPNEEGDHLADLQDMKISQP